MTSRLTWRRIGQTALAVIVAALAGAPAYSAWTLQTSPTTQELFDVSFFSTTTGYAVGKTGGPSTIINTTDGGVNWNSLPSAPALEFHGVAAVSASVAYVVGGGGVIYKSIDTGASWTPQASGTGNDLESVHFVDPSTGWVVGASGAILHTADGGANWNSQPSGTGVDLFGVSFADASVGWAVGGGGTILKTVNGGTTWVPQTSGASNDLFGVSAPSTAVAYAVGGGGTILKTIDGGSNWTQPTSPTSQDLDDTDFPTTSIGYAVGKNGIILKTVDSGANWNVQCSATGQQLHAVDAPTTLIAYAVGKSGTIMKTTGGGFFAGGDITGVVFEDADFSGTSSDYDGGVIDLGLENVDVELYDATDTLVTPQTTGADGSYSFTCVADGTYKVRARSATIGDKNTPPKDGFHVACGIQDPATGFACALAELTWADGAALMGGQDPNVDDSATDDDNGPGDTYTAVTVSGADLTGVNFGFAYYLIVKTGDGGQGSLRQAIRNANAISGAVTLSIPAGTYSLTLVGAGEDAAATGDLDVTDDLVLSGSDATTRIIDGVASDRVFQIPSGVTATLSGITIRGGNALGGRGGGIYNTGTLTISDAIVANNTDSNEGGGIQNDGGGGPASLTITNSRISGNTSPAGKGGGIHNIGDAFTTFDLTDVTLDGNSADEGGAIRNEVGVGTLTNVSISGNSSNLGGGILNRSTGAVLTLTNCTISGNTSTGEGGGIQQQGTSANLTNVTIADNSAATGGGLRHKSGTTQILNTIIAGNPSGSDCSGTITSNGYNLDGDGSCALAGPGDISNGAANLGPLADNGGSTETHALLFGSAAIDAVLAGCPPPATDQRGIARPFDGDGDLTASCDIGAFESNVVPTLISGTLYEDVDGDSGLGDAVAAGNVRVRLYEDVNDNGQVDAGDTFIGETTTNATTGGYSFGVGSGSKFLVVVDSKTVAPSDGLNGGHAQGEVWAEQTYGDDPATPALDFGARLGGRTAGTSDEVDAASTDPADNTYQHLARVDVSGGSVSGVDFAFSFRTVTHVGDSDDDLAASRTAQGSLRQLIQNANAIVGAPSLEIPAGTYALTLIGTGEDGALTGDLDITEDVTLSGASPSTTAIDGNRTDRVLELFAATVQLSDLTVEKGDSQGDHGGGILIDVSSSLTVVDTMIRDNDGDRGGGIRVDGDLTVSRSTLYANRGSQGGAIQTSGSTQNVILTNVSVSGNTATSRGGGLEIDLSTLTNVTVTGNTSPSGGGIYRRGGNTFTIKNSIVAGNLSGGDCANAFTSAGYNLDGDGTCALGGPGDISNGTANLGPLADNGGPTLTHALLAGSQAIDAVLAGCPPPATDQRGVARPVGADCDIGAYELDGSSLSGVVYHDVNSNSVFDPGESGIGTVWVKLVSGGSVVGVDQADRDTGAYTLGGVPDGSYSMIVDDNGNPADSTATAPVNWLFQNPGSGSLSVTVAGTDITDRDFGLTFNFDLGADCVCGYEDGLLAQRTITVDGDMSDWGAVFSDGDNNACDATDDTDRDHPVQSNGRNLLRTAVTYDGTYFSMWTQRVGQSSNTQSFVYYSDTNADGIMQAGEPVIVAKWIGATGDVELELYSYDDLGSGGDSMLDGSGFADGYALPGDLTLVKTLTLPDGAGQGSTSGASDGTQMEWTIEWAELGVPPGAAIGWHVGSTNSNPAASGLGAQIDDNIGGCGGQCGGSNQFAGIQGSPGVGINGDTIYVPHSFTNTGNGTDLFDFTWTSTGDFVPTSVVFYRDLGTVGQYDPGVDTLIVDTDGDSDPDTGNLATGESFDMLVAIELPGPPALGAATVTTTATSNFVPGCGGTIIPESRSVDDVVEISYSISGTVFEDVNYGGGIGRDLAAAQADAPSFTVRRGNVTVELYDAAGTFVSSIATAVADGSYAFTGLTPADYIVRVVNDTVTSSRPGSDGSELGAQTYRIDGDGEPVGTGAKKVGGELPSNEDAAANSGAQTLASLQGTDLDTDGVTEWTQSIVTVDASSGDVTGVDFGFNFDVIVNTNDAGQGSLRRFILNSNLLN